ncbi:MAG: dihydroorotase [Leptospirales bacterium]|jgi:dihydroorotase
MPAAPKTRITIPRPDDWHLHLRDGDALQAVLPDTARRFARAIVMPNLKPPVRAIEDAAAYRDRILRVLESHVAAGRLAAKVDFTPLMTLYLTPETTPETVRAAAASDFIHGIKLYPAGATTNSEAGVGSLDAMSAVFEAMQREGLILQIHGEVTGGDVDIFDRERVFIERHLIPIVERFPELKIVLEHITTRDAADYVASTPETVGATITPQHLLMNRNAIFLGGIRPHHYCLPILKREEHRLALVRAITGDPQKKFFIGTDSAPHATHTKEAECGCAGIYSSHGGVEFYAEVFDAADALVSKDGGADERFADFMSRNGPAFYGLPINASTLTIEKVDCQVPAAIKFGVHSLTPLRAGAALGWRIVE